MTKQNSNTARTVVTACIALVIGILFVCSRSFGTSGLSWLVGLSLCVIGIIYVAGSLVHKKALISADGIIGVTISAFGVMFIIRRMAGIIMDFIPYLMIAVGIAMLIDAFLGKLARGERSTLKFVLALLIGAAATALGFLIKFIDGWADAAATVLGIIMIVYAVFIIISMLVKKKIGTKK